MYDVILERDECKMCGHCVELDETVFNFDDDDKATLIGSEREDDVDEISVDDITIYQDAQTTCTGDCIEIYDEEGNTV
ncbi:MAG: ferredoxin [Methanobacteriaceae archaeon]|nr:ferredoxin [Methanobacteriaceae archaeon]